MMTRRKFLFTLAGLSASLGFGVPAYARYIEPRWLELTRKKIVWRGGPLKSRLRVLHLADFHLGQDVPLSFIEEAVDMGLRTQPDLVCLTGDYITGRLHDPVAYATVLTRLADFAPTFACLGNHDGGAWVASRGGYRTVQEISEFLNTCGVICLLNERRVLQIKDQEIEIAGLGDLWTEYFLPAQVLTSAAIPSPRPVLLLAHNPDTKDEIKSYTWDLMLCGHTHGGQVALPFLGTPFAPVQDQRFVEGLHTWDGRLLHITRGVGNLHGIRFNCRPEVSLLEWV